MATIEYVDLAHLLENSDDVLARLTDNNHLVVHGGDEGDFILRTATASARVQAELSGVLRLFRAVTITQGAGALAAKSVPAVFPWVRRLTDDEARQFADEWLEALDAAADSGATDAVAAVVERWRGRACAREATD